MSLLAACQVLGWNASWCWHTTGRTIAGWQRCRISPSSSTRCCSLYSLDPFDSPRFKQGLKGAPFSSFFMLLQDERHVHNNGTAWGSLGAFSPQWASCRYDAQRACAPADVPAEHGAQHGVMLSPACSCAALLLTELFALQANNDSAPLQTPKGECGTVSAVPHLGRSNAAADTVIQHS